MSVVFTRNFIVAGFSLLAVLLGVSVAHSQGASPVRLSISGKVAYRDHPEMRFSNAIVIVPADTPQPIHLTPDSKFIYDARPDGTFTATGLSAGNYLIGLEANPELVPSLSKVITLLIDSADQDVPPTAFALPAQEVTLTGDAPVSVDLVIDVLPLPAPSPDVSLPLLPAGKASISGSIHLSNCDTCIDQFSVVIVPKSLKTRLDLAPNSPDFGYSFLTDPKGSFRIIDLAAGDYLVAPAVRGLDFVQRFSDTIHTAGPDGKAVDLPAVSVHLEDGQQAGGLDFAIAPLPAVDADGSAAAQGHTGGPASDTAELAIASFAVFIIALLAGRVALRARRASSLTR